MSEYIVYLILIFVVLVIYLLLVKQNMSKKNIERICILLFMTLYIFINVYQYSFLKFIDISNALKYIYPNAKILNKTIYNEYAFIIFENSNDKSISFTYFIKENEKWKYRKDLFFEFNSFEVGKYYIIEKYIKKYDICYVYLSYYENKANLDIVLSNVNNDYINKKTYKISDDYYRYSYYLIIQDYSKSNYIIINNEKIKI